MKKFYRSLKNFFKKLPIVLIFHIFVIIYIIGSIFYVRSISQKFYEIEKEEILSFAKSSEIFIDPYDIIKLDANISDVNKPNYQFLKTNLIKLKNAKNNIVFAYLMTNIDNKIVFLVDSEDPTSVDYSYPGQLYYEATEYDFEPFLTNETVITPETKDRWGTWVSVLVPIMHNNKVIAVLGLDLDAALFNQSILTQTLNVIYILLSILMLIVVFYWMIKKNLELKKISSQLAESESLFKAVFDQSPIGIATISDDSKTARVNAAYIEIINRTHQDIVKNDWKAMTHPDDLAREEILFDAFKKGEIFEYELEKRLKMNENDYFWVRLGISSLNLGINSKFSYLCLIQDISESVKTNLALKESERSKDVLLSHIPGLAYRCKNDVCWTMEYVSAGCLNLTGYFPEDFIQNKKLSYNDIIDAQYKDILRNQWDQVLLKHENFRAEYQIITLQEEYKWVLELGQGIYDYDGSVIAIEGIVIDITETKIRDAQLRYMDDHDFLTGLYNRKYFEIEKVRFNQEAYLPMSLLIGDINGVRLINDAYGYAQGDRLITDTAKILQNVCGTHAVLFRTGGDEFTVLMPNTSNEKVHEIMRRIQHNCVSYNQSLEDESIQLNLSLGSSTRIQMHQSIDKVLHEALDSLHKNKILESKSYHSSILSSIQATMFAKSQNTEEHAERLAILCKFMGRELALTQSQMDELLLFAMLHDIGKIGIDDRILNKPGKLTDEEWIIMKKHTEIGYRIALSSPELHSIANYILSHHEFWDGNGYPQGLKEEEIPLLSRILSLVDAYDAMTQDRVYRLAMSRNNAIVEIQNNSGTQFDPKLTGIFIKILNQNTDL